MRAPILGSVDRKTIGGLIFSSLLIGACVGGNRVEDSQGEQSINEGTLASDLKLEAVGVHGNPDTGIVAVVTHDVTLSESGFPNIQVSVVTEQAIPESIPESCEVSIGPADQTVDGFSMGFQFVSSAQDRIRVDRFVEWSDAEISFSNCGILDGTSYGITGEFQSGVQPPEDSDPRSIWEVVPLFSTYNLKANPALPVKRLSQFLGSTSGATARRGVVASDVDVAVSETENGSMLQVAAGVEALRQSWRSSVSDALDVMSSPLERSLIDRPDDVPGVAQLKFIYVVPSFAEDRQRDTSGEISKFAAHVNEWWALQNGGYGLRIDTFEGAIDVGYWPIDISEQQWDRYFDDYRQRPLFKNGLSEFQQPLSDAGWGNTLRTAEDVQLGGVSERDSRIRNEKLYMLVFEGPAGTYGRTGQSRECSSMIDAINDVVPIIVFPMSTRQGESCGSLPLDRYPIAGTSTQENSWVRARLGAIDHVAMWMRHLPRCEPAKTPKDGEPVVIPGVVDPAKATEIRGGFMRDLAEPGDPLGDVFSSGPGSEIPQFDPRHELYFHIVADKLADDGMCNGDISKHPLWDTRSFSREFETSLQRSSYDREDDFFGPQVKFVYVVEGERNDRWFDTSGELSRVADQMQRFISESTRGANTVRIDSYGDRIDVLYFPLIPEDEPCEGAGCSLEGRIVKALTHADRLENDKYLVAFYDGPIDSTKGFCGVASDEIALVNLSAATSEVCEDLKIFSDDPFDWSVGLLALHELLHSMGAVCSDSTINDDGHSSIEGDLMYEQAKGSVSLDPGRGYWSGGSATCEPLSQNEVFLPFK